MKTKRPSELTAAGQGALWSRNSLTFRLLIGASLLCGTTLATAYVLLATLLEVQLKHQVDAELTEQLRGLAAGVEIVQSEADSPTLRLLRAPGGSRYSRPLSGYYWQIEMPDGVLLRSRSLGEAELPRSSAAAGRGGVAIREVTGPRTERLRLMQRTVLFDGLPGEIALSAAVDLAPVMKTTREWSLILVGGLAVLGIGLVSVALFQTRMGLRPLQEIRAELAAIREGREWRIAREVPSEIKPLAHELNALLEHHRDLIERARLYASKLAKAIERPLQILREELQSETPPDRAVLSEQILAIDNIVHRSMAIARAVGGPNLLGKRAEVSRTVEALVYTLRHIDTERNVKVSIDIPTRPLWFAGDSLDFSELMGNLLDYSRRMAGRLVTVRAAKVGDRLRISIVGDVAECGATGTPARLIDADNQPGAGGDLCLVIARDLAMQYNGKVRAGRSDDGGLVIDVDMPGA